MAKGSGGGGGTRGVGGAGGRSATAAGGGAAASVAAVNAVGVQNADYLRGGMRDLTAVRSAYEGASKAQAEAIATGKAPPMNAGKFGPAGKPLPAVNVDVYLGARGKAPQISLRDGRHRMTAAREAGARHIRAIVTTYGQRGAVKSRAEAIVSIRGKSS